MSIPTYETMFDRHFNNTIANNFLGVTENLYKIEGLIKNEGKTRDSKLLIDKVVVTSEIFELKEDILYNLNFATLKKVPNTISINLALVNDLLKANGLANEAINDCVKDCAKEILVVRDVFQKKVNNITSLQYSYMEALGRLSWIYEAYSSIDFHVLKRDEEYGSIVKMNKIFLKLFDELPGMEAGSYAEHSEMQKVLRIFWLQQNEEWIAIAEEQIYSTLLKTSKLLVTLKDPSHNDLFLKFTNSFSELEVLRILEAK